MIVTLKLKGWLYGWFWTDFHFAVICACSDVCGYVICVYVKMLLISL